MMTMEEIDGMQPPINSEAIKAGLGAVEKRLEESMTASANFDTKAVTALAGFAPITIAIWGAAAATYDNHIVLAVGLGFCGLSFALSTLLLAVVLAPRPYNVPGSAPEVWLKADLLTGDEVALSKHLAKQIRLHHRRIEVNETLNAKKARWLKWSIGFAASSPAVFIVFLALAEIVRLAIPISCSGPT